ncbi:MAG: dihydrofolate reductase family protein [Candidatus Nanopelagicales bacterium]
MADVRPVVVVHNSISADGATTGFLPHLGQHYDIAHRLGARARLVGSVTMASGLDHVSAPAPADPGPATDVPPTDRDELPWWFLVDSTGRLDGRLHELRAFPGLRDVVVLVSRSTPRTYLDYLDERGYRYLVSGGQRVMLAQALPWIRDTFDVDRILVDSGPVLTHVMLDHELVDELSLMVHPVVVGDAGRRVLEGSATKHRLELIAAERLDYDVLHLHYRVRDIEPV